MTSYSEHLSILAAPEIQDIYSIPKLNPQEQEYFFALTDEELAIVNRLNTTRNRIHLILEISGCLKQKFRAFYLEPSIY